MEMSNASPQSELERDVGELERKLATLLAHTRALRKANEALRHDLAAASARNQALAARVATARERLDDLLARMPMSAQ